MSSTDMRRIGVDLNDRGLIWIELSPGEICSEQKQYIAAENGVIAGGSPDDTGHADVVGIVILHEVLAARGVRHRRLQTRRRRDNFVMSTGAAGPGIDRDRTALVENGGDLSEVRVVRADERIPSVDGIGRFVVGCGI